MSWWLAACLAALAAMAACAPPSGRARLRDLRHASPGRGNAVLPGPAPALLGAVAGWAALGPVAGVLLGVAVIALQPSLHARQRSGDDRAERARAVEALAVLGGDLRAGRHPADALVAAAEVARGDVATALAAGAAAARLGGDVAQALLVHSTSCPHALRGLAACWAVCTTSGSGLAAGVDRLADGLRAEAAQRALVDAELAGPRATAVLLAALPLGGLALAAALGADPVRMLLHTPAGLVCLVAGLTLDVLGLLWTRRLVGAAGGA